MQQQQQKKQQKQQAPQISQEDLDLARKRPPQLTPQTQPTPQKQPEAHLLNPPPTSAQQPPSVERAAAAGDAVTKVAAVPSASTCVEVRPGAEADDEDEYSEALAAAAWRAKLIKDLDAARTSGAAAPSSEGPQQGA